MSLEDVIQRVEAEHFTAEMNLASSSSTFHNALRAHPTFRDLCEEMRTAVGSILVFRRLEFLSDQPVESAFENPFDVALTAYLAAIELYAPDLVRAAAERVCRTRNCWWAAEFSSRLLERIGSVQMPLATHEPAINQGMGDKGAAGTIARNLLVQEKGTLEALRQQLLGLQGGPISINDVQSAITCTVERYPSRSQRGSTRKATKKRRPGKIAA